MSEISLITTLLQGYILKYQHQHINMGQYIGIENFLNYFHISRALHRTGNENGRQVVAVTCATQCCDLTAAVNTHYDPDITLVITSALHVRKALDCVCTVTLVYAE